MMASNFEPDDSLEVQKCNDFRNGACLKTTAKNHFLVEITFNGHIVKYNWKLVYSHTLRKLSQKVSKYSDFQKIHFQQTSQKIMNGASNGVTWQC